ncbi:unnamed protein product [Ectocarpus sp. 4 AP-2014]|uniref:EsV-1-221 n=1 Tax=Ectocarpus siliculosus virus 1 (isolate New Zealand/Kaikoura/1988) TaxID=654926 RepID=Q8QN69_ESV1K|nr:EsV-1-221 [Ectocarpus siliculosus virus 1]AAK14635.1 EsV-1-221 [Ectocarpus siliculosus virus 1]
MIFSVNGILNTKLRLRRHRLCHLWSNNLLPRRRIPCNRLQSRQARVSCRGAHKKICTGGYIRPITEEYS